VKAERHTLADKVLGSRSIRRRGRAVSDAPREHGQTSVYAEGVTERRITKRYSNGEVTVVWQPHLCVHSAICTRGLPDVFDPRRRPWVAIDAASTDSIVAQVARCPSGALSTIMDAEPEKQPGE